jgi:riboflavin kinase/FMN adenylyltransferase
MHTKLVRSLYSICPNQQGGVITIGNFDGVHLGHQQLIKRVVAEAQKRGVPSTVITFEPHPFEFFAGEKLTIPRITRLREKFSALRKLGVNNVLIIQFEQQVANISASDFVNLLAAKLKPVHVIVGDDFHFGKARQGNLQLLQTMGKELGFTATEMPTYEIESERVSSTRVRKALAGGDQQLANRLLGRPYTMMGRVRPGDQLGRKLGFPTANIFVHRRLTAVNGIYIVRMHGIDGRSLPGVANVGIRPTVDGTRTLLEVHLLDFNQDIYNRYVEVEFIAKIRDEERYDTLDLLKEKIAEDVVIGRQFFAKQDNT